MIDPVSAVGSAAGIGGSIGLAIRAGGWLVEFLKAREERKVKEEAIRHQQIIDYQQSVDSVQVELQEVELYHENSWKICGFILFERKYKVEGRKPVFTLRQHAISYAIYCWVSVIALCTFLFVDNPERILWSIDPTNRDRQFGIFWKFITWDLPAETPFQISTGGIGWALLSVMTGIMTLLLVGVAGQKR
jgi:hypothetical protein